MIHDGIMAAAGSTSPTYTSDVFNTTVYSGNGGTLNVTNGINLSTYGGFIWIKHRNAALVSSAFFDTQRVGGLDAGFATDAPGAAVTGFAGSVSSTGFSFANSDVRINALDAPYVAWTFRKKKNFLDIVTYTGNNAVQNINHSLGSAPGMIWFTSPSDAAFRYVYTEALGNTTRISLDSSSSVTTGSTSWNSTSPTSTQFTVASNVNINGSGLPYVAYLFANDTSPDGLIRCGSFTTDAGGVANISLGWEPQFIVIRAPLVVDTWRVFDTVRGIPYSTAITTNVSPSTLEASEADVEYGSSLKFSLNPDGFGIISTALSTQYIYIAVRRDNKPPNTATKVFTPLNTGTGLTLTDSAASIGFYPDLILRKDKLAASGNLDNTVFDRIRGFNNRVSLLVTSSSAPIIKILSQTTSTESYPTSPNIRQEINGDFSYGSDFSLKNMMHYHFKRAPKFFETVCYDGTGIARTIAHGLKSVPELIIVKSRTAAGNWSVYNESSTAGRNLLLNSTAAEETFSLLWNFAPPTSQVFSLSGAAAVNASAVSYIAYLFATLPGISKISKYVGNGSSQDIDCGFSNGARFVLIKRIDAAGDWLYWDNVRGIIAGNDPYLTLNKSIAEVGTVDAVDPISSGFTVNQEATAAINVTSGHYFFFAIA